ncbi:cytochrome P450 [Filobacillus milosensis]|uniref:Cytochrome P450 n=1 Tax=Filobacillus milosensis TaxID=94137 RepID=A0A4Y8IFA3_9BACI|nr:cytochrome P450 [Filobacillus milosensis]TFB18532.1 cytochrome P450 [Filobacillus milosensis]
MSEHEQNMPKEGGVDHTLDLLNEGYYFILNRKNKFDSRVLETRLLGEKAICLVGKQEAELFYNEDYFTRVEAAPNRVKKTLLGEGGVQGLDGEEHRHRKAMFMNLMTKDSLDEISRLTREEWDHAIEANTQEELNVYDEAKRVLTRVALRWTGVPFKDEDVDQWASELGDMFEKASKVGPKHWKSRRSRSKVEDWIEDLIKDVRDDAIQVEQSRALYVFSNHRDLEGKFLDKHVAAVEIINLLRPIVAIAVFIDFVALSIQQFPEEAKKLKAGSAEDLQNYTQEVRRYFPFFPAAIARVKKNFTWQGYDFKENTLTLLDLYGTNQDPDLWHFPDNFTPKRFKEWQGSPFDFIPQGGGEFDIGHRCAGEWITIEIMKETLDYFINQISYKFPQQDLSYSMNDIPALPKSRVKIKHVEKIK